jgi:hypothetical protein
MATNQRSRTAILSGVKIVVLQKSGSHADLMAERYLPPARRKVSRATVLQSFQRDKEEMMLSRS